MTTELWETVHEPTRARRAARRLWSGGRQFPVTEGLLLAIAAARILQHADPDLAARWEWASSTTLAQIADHPLKVMIGSIPWLAVGPLGPWLALAGLAVGSLEVTVGSVPTLAVVLTGHVGATLISEGILGLRVAGGGLPHSALHVLDVGPSYVVATALAATVVLPSRRAVRAVTGLTLLVAAPIMVNGVQRAELDAVGHAAAFAIGALTGLIPRLRCRAPAG